MIKKKSLTDFFCNKLWSVFFAERTLPFETKPKQQIFLRMEYTNSFLGTVYCKKIKKNTLFEHFFLDFNNLFNGVFGSFQPFVGFALEGWANFRGTPYKVYVHKLALYLLHV